MAKIIGRTEEIVSMNRLYDSGKAELVAVYGRRRIGKTFLVDESLKGKISFRHAGLSPVDEQGKHNFLKDQLKHFYYSLQLHGMKKSKCPSSWQEAFFLLETHLQNTDNGGRQVVFLDELPWLDTPRSGFLTAFEGFWNSWGCHRDNLMVVVCGSANSWILDNLINNHGGLYGRVTYEIKLLPFTLKEMEMFFRERGIAISRYDIVQCNMILGGIPYYLNYFKRGKSLAQNIDALFFDDKATLKEEYDRLFSSIFTSPEELKKIVGVLASNRSGLTRDEISKKTGIEPNGYFTKMLKALIASDFVSRYVPFGEKKTCEHYKLIDPFCIFYLHFVASQNSLNADFWTLNQSSQSIVSWRGFAFEEVCLRHIGQIKAALGISGVVSRQSSWKTNGSGDVPGSQIDLLIERKDNVVNMCEMKFYNDEYVVSRAYERVLTSRFNALKECLPKRCAIHNTLITTYGLKYNEYSGVFQNVVTMDALFDDGSN